MEDICNGKIDANNLGNEPSSGVDRGGDVEINSPKFLLRGMLNGVITLNFSRLV